MAGKLTNLRYDKNASNENVRRSTNQMMYMIDPNFANNCNPCLATHGPHNGHHYTVDDGEKIDIDSILKNMNKINSKSNVQQMPTPLNQYNKHTPKECSNALEQNNSRYTHPANEIRGLNVSDMRLSYPLHDPQCNIFEDFSVNTRLQAKDNHKTIWQVPIDQRASLPTERLGRVKNCTLTVNCNYAPYTDM